MKFLQTKEINLLIIRCFKKLNFCVCMINVSADLFEFSFGWLIFSPNYNNNIKNKIIRIFNLFIFVLRGIVNVRGKEMDKQFEFFYSWYAFSKCLLIFALYRIYCGFHSKNALTENLANRFLFMNFM